MRTPICFYQTRQRHSQPRCDKTHYLRLFRTAINICLHRMMIKQNCFGLIVAIRMPYVRSLASTNPYTERRNTLVCLRCNYGFPKPMQFDYNISTQQTRQLKKSSTQKRTNTSAQKIINSQTHELINLKTH